LKLLDHTLTFRGSIPVAQAWLVATYTCQATSNFLECLTVPSDMVALVQDVGP
jgi:hypothetical protein